MAERLDPRFLGADPAWASFLATSRSTLVGRLDPQGRVAAANPALRRWLGPEPAGNLEGALRPRSAERWRRALSEVGRSGASRVVRLRFARDEAGRAGYRCLLTREPGDQPVWLFGERLTAERPEQRPPRGPLELRLERARRRLRYLAHTDILTGLANRRQGDRWLARLTHEALSEGDDLACLMVDLDHFKVINDTLGHLVGDRVLKAVAQTLAERLRPPDRLARFGGEEFLVLLPGKDTVAAAAQAEELRRHLASRRPDPLDRPLSASFGVAALRPGETAEGLVMRADAALGRAKRNGRDRVEVDA